MCSSPSRPFAAGLPPLLRAPKAPIVCYVTDRKSLRASPQGLALRERIQMAVLAGVDWVQIREKDMPARELADLVRIALEAGEALGGAAGAGGESGAAR